MNRAFARLVPLFWLTLLAAACPAVTPMTRYPAAERIVAMADWHGDLAAARGALRLAGAIDDQDRWIGGRLVVVQTGDVLDRGDGERAILDLLARLEDEAAAAGGAVIALLGNHEIMSVAGDFDDATPGAFAAFADLADTTLVALPPEQRGRAAALRPGGPYARQLAGRNVVAIVGRNVFVHGGIRPEHLALGLDRINEETRAWLRGETPLPPWLNVKDSPTWTRGYSDEPDGDDCAQLAAVLAALDCDRMFMGHTVQAGRASPPVATAGPGAWTRAPARTTAGRSRSWRSAATRSGCCASAQERRCRARTRTAGFPLFFDGRSRFQAAVPPFS